MNVSIAPNEISVALLEDQRVLRDSLGELLAHHGYLVRLSAGTPAELLGGLTHHRPSLLLADLRLAPGTGTGPSDEGWGAIRFVRQWYPDVRVVVLSGSRDPVDVRRAQQEGAVGFLHKDTISGPELLRAVERVVRGESVFPMFTQALMGAPNTPLPETPEALRNLTHRELQVLRYVASGYDNLKISACMDISERTVRAHVSNLYRKLGSENRAQLALLARELGVRPATE